MRASNAYATNPLKKFRRVLVQLKSWVGLKINDNGVNLKRIHQFYEILLPFFNQNKNRFLSVEYQYHQYKYQYREGGLHSEQNLAKFCT